MDELVNALLAFDTATERMSIALARGDAVWMHDEAGGALASARLVPAILELLARAGIGLRELDAIAHGRGPGAFTGLRTACAVAQGLAFGAGLPVLPVDTLMAIAEDARAGAPQWQGWAVLDARMDEIYAARYRYADGAWQTLDAPRLCTADALNEAWRLEPPAQLAGNALLAHADRLHVGAAACRPDAQPRAHALLGPARQAWAQGGAVDAALALPTYLRDKVALTTAEREAARGTQPG